VDHAIGRAYGAEKGPDEQYPAFPKRISYLIDPSGAIAAAYDLAGTDLSEHASVVLADIRARS